MKTLLRKEFNKLTLERFPNLYRPDSLPYISEILLENLQVTFLMRLNLLTQKM